VNAHSSVPKEPWFFKALSGGAIPAMPAVEHAFWYSVIWSAAYHTAASVTRPWFRRYRHHRTLGIREVVPWARGAVRKVTCRRREKGLQEQLTTTWARKYFLVPLQVHNDAQVKVHSDYESVGAFVGEVIASFARHAAKGTRLVLKHHPLDRGYNDYSALIAREARRNAVEGRVVYIHDQHLPSLLDATCGVVVINSTAGLQALDHGVPVKVCGRAAYDIEGLTFRGTLDAFWKGAEEFTIDPELFAAFKRYLVTHTQLGGSFYRRLETGELLLDVNGGAPRLVPDLVPEKAPVVVESERSVAVMSAAE
jgi:capsular polysaccharide export protein